MPEYRIVTKIDPSGVVAGRAKVEQELRNLDNSVNRTTGGMERMTAAEFKAAGGLDGLNRASSQAAGGQKNLEAAAQRVLKAVDAEAAGLRKMNTLLDEARRLHAAGVISAEQFAKVQTMVDQGVRRSTVSLGQQRAGYTQLGFQIQDITQTIALGINPLTVLAQQGGQTASALSLALGTEGKLGKVATFMAGPFGSIILASVTVLGMLAVKFLSVGDATEEALEQLKKDAAQTEATDKAKAMFAQTLEGVVQAVHEQNEALKESQKSQRQAEIDAFNLANAQLQIEINTRKATQAMLEQAIEQERSLREQEKRAEGRGTGGTLAGREGADLLGMAAGITQGRITSLEASLAKTESLIGTAEERLRRTAIPILQRQVAEATDRTTKANADFEREQDRLNVALAKGEITTAAYRTGLTTATNARDAEIKKIQEQEAAERRLQRTQSDGVARFRTREQAIGIAGRELQGRGLRVSENEQFGGVLQNHPGMGNTAHGKYAVDVNQGAGITEADVPDIKAKFDQLARQYQARGYRVLWNGMVWEAGGNGPTRPITSGPKHYDHMHLEAPGTIVGKATQASLASAQAQEMREGESKADFVQGIVDQASLRGLPDGREADLKSRVDKVLADYQRKFNEPLTGPGKDAVVKALTDADAREIAQNFEDAYVKPLERLQALQGRTGVDREVLNAQLEESARLQRELKPEEAASIENSIRKSRALETEAQILERIRRPVDDYIEQVARLEALLAKGAISQDKFNYEVGQLPLAASSRDQGVRLGVTSEVDAKEDEIRAELQREADLNQMFYDAGVISHDEYERRKTQITRREADARVNAERQVNITRLQLAQQISNDLLSIAEMAVGKQNAVYKALFVASKAFAIAEAIIKIQQGIANALALPFPANLPAIAQVVAAGASIVSSIQAVALNLADGGLVRGPGGPRDDRVPANLSAGEFVVNSAAVARPGNRALLEALNDGAVTNATRRARNDNLPGMGREVGGDSYAFTFGDVVVQTGAGVTGQDGQQIGRDVKQALAELVDERMRVASRPGGPLTRTRQSVIG